MDLVRKSEIKRIEYRPDVKIGEYVKRERWVSCGIGIFKGRELITEEGYLLLGWPLGLLSKKDIEEKTYYSINENGHVLINPCLIITISSEKITINNINSELYSAFLREMEDSRYPWVDLNDYRHSKVDNV